ncbi:hypothetical protein, partial [Deinococcus arenicola]
GVFIAENTLLEPAFCFRSGVLRGSQAQGYLTLGKNGHYVKMVAHKKPSTSAPKPRGGVFF